MLTELLKARVTCDNCFHMLHWGRIKIRKFRLFHIYTYLARECVLYDVIVLPHGTNFQKTRLRSWEHIYLFEQEPGGWALHVDRPKFVLNSKFLLMKLVTRKRISNEFLVINEKRVSVGTSQDRFCFHVCISIDANREQTEAIGRNLVNIFQF